MMHKCFLDNKNAFMWHKYVFLNCLMLHVCTSLKKLLTSILNSCHKHKSMNVFVHKKFVVFSLLSFIGRFYLVLKLKVSLFHRTWSRAWYNFASIEIVIQMKVEAGRNYFLIMVLMVDEVNLLLALWIFVLFLLEIVTAFQMQFEFVSPEWF